MIEPLGLFYLDSNVFIDALEGEPAFAQPAEELLRYLGAFPRAAITSELTLAEVLAPSQNKSRLRLKRRYLDLIIWRRFIELKPVTRSVLLDSAKYRSAHTPKLKLPDAIHLVTAGQSRCKLFVSRDTRINPPKGMKRSPPNVVTVATLLESK